MSISKTAIRSLLLAGLSILAISACQSPDVAVDPARALADPTWEIQYADSTALFIGLYIVDENIVWASGSGGRVARTTDGGTNWEVTVVPGAESLQFRDVHAFSATEAFALTIGNGTDSRIYRTGDGAQSWDLMFQNTDENAFFDCLSFWDRHRGFAFSDSHDGEFTLIVTENGGTGWERIDPALVPDARPGEGGFAASGTCVQTRPGGLGWFATGASAVDTRVIRTSDYGATWSEAPTPIESNASTAGISSMSFLDDRNGAVFGGDFTQVDSMFAPVAITTDGGDTWTLANTTTLGGAIYGGAYVPGAPTPTLVVVSPTGSEYSTDNGWTWTRIDSGDYWTVAFLSPELGWAAGRGQISRIVNGGGRP
jgi:photosystem II stability/assembly factor-like uncharacterized protein